MTKKIDDGGHRQRYKFGILRALQQKGSSNG